MQFFHHFGQEQRSARCGAELVYQKPSLPSLSRNSEQPLLAKDLAWTLLTIWGSDLASTANRHPRYPAHQVAHAAAGGPVHELCPPSPWSRRKPPTPLSIDIIDSLTDCLRPVKPSRRPPAGGRSKMEKLLARRTTALTNAKRLRSAVRAVRARARHPSAFKPQEYALTVASSWPRRSCSARPLSPTAHPQEKAVSFLVSRRFDPTKRFGSDQRGLPSSRSYGTGGLDPHAMAEPMSAHESLTSCQTAETVALFVPEGAHRVCIAEMPTSSRR